MDGSLEETVSKAVSKVQPVRAVFFRRSQLIQDGVVVDDGPTLEDIKAQEKEEKIREEEAAGEGDELSDDSDSDSESDSSEETVDDIVKEAEEDDNSDDADYGSMTVAQLKELLKEKGMPVSGKKADLISRLSE
jgi:ABC-type multidrug transport system ATPase subunit